MTAPLDSIKGTPVFDIAVGWSDEAQKGNSQVTLFTRHQYLRLLQQLPEVLPDVDEFGNPIPLDPSEPEVDRFPESPEFVLQDIYDGVAGADAGTEEVLNGLLELSDSGRLSPGMVQAIDELLLMMQIAGVIEEVTPAVPRDPPEPLEPVVTEYAPPVVVMTSGSLADALNVWRDLPEIENLMNEITHVGVNARIIQLAEADQFSNTSLQHLIRFEYIQRGNEIMFNALADLHDSLELVEEAMGVLNRVGDILNQKSPEEAKVDLVELVGLNRNESGYLVDAASGGKGEPSRDPKSYAAALDAWERRQFDKELDRIVLDLGDENEGFISGYNSNFNLTSATRTEHESPFVDDVRNGNSDTEFEGTVTNLQDGLPIVPGSFELSAEVEGGVTETFTDKDLKRKSDDPQDPDYNIGILLGNLGKADDDDIEVALGEINYLTGEWEVEFNFDVLDDQNLTINYKQPETFRVTNVVGGVGNNVDTAFEDKSETFPLLPDTFRVTDGSETFTVDPPGAGPIQTLVGDRGGTGTVNLDTGEWEVTFASPPLTGAQVLYQYDHRQIHVVDKPLFDGDGVVATVDGVIEPDPDEAGEVGVLVPYPITEGSLKIWDERETFTPDPNDPSILVGNLGGTGTIDYETGEYSVTFNTPPSIGEGNIKASFTHQVAEPFIIQNEPINNTGGDPLNQSGTIVHVPIVPGSLLIRDGDTTDDDAGNNEEFTDRGDGILVDVDGNEAGNINYQTGEWNVRFESAPNNVNAKYEVFTGVPDDDATLLTHIGAQVTQLKNKLPEGDLRDAIEKVEQDLLGNTFVPTIDTPVFSLNVYIKDFAEGSQASGDYQRNLNAALVAAQSLNDSEKEELRRRMFEFEEFYKSASAVMNKIHQILEKIAQGISR